MRSTLGEMVAQGPEPGPHTGQEFLESERLPQVVVRAKIEPFDPVVHASPGTEHEDRNRGSPLPQARKHIKAIQAGQAEIQYHERDAGVHETPERVLAGLRPFDGVAMRAEPFLEERRDTLFVLDDQDRHRGTLIQNVAPLPGRLTTPDSPLWALATPGRWRVPSPCLPFAMIWC